MKEKIKNAQEALDKDTFGAATLRVILRVVFIYVIFWIFQKTAGSP